MPVPVVPATNIRMTDLANSCGVEISTNLSLNGLRAGSGGDLSTSDTDSGETAAEAINNSETLIDVSDGSSFSANQYIKIGSEFMRILSISGDTLTVNREESSIENEGSSPGNATGDSHNNGATIYFANPFVPYHFPTATAFGSGSITQVKGYLTTWLVANANDGIYGENTTNIGMKQTFYTDAGSGRSADSDGVVGK
tara:strand:+ start:43 stop:636 length:594 start_codon:yes stop_codon:yes gene_type:complete